MPTQGRRKQGLNTWGQAELTDITVSAQPTKNNILSFQYEHVRLHIHFYKHYNNVCRCMYMYMYMYACTCTLCMYYMYTLYMHSVKEMCAVYGHTSVRESVLSDSPLDAGSD